MSTYDYKKFDEIIEKLLRDSLRDPDYLEIGEDISDIPEIKIIFDGYGDLETEDEYIEGGDKNNESYAIFIHKDSAQEDFEFPEHDSAAFTFGSMIYHRPKEEVCIYAWYDVEDDQYSIGDYPDDKDLFMTPDYTMGILEALDARYYSSIVPETPYDPKNLTTTAWPFADKKD